MEKVIVFLLNEELYALSILSVREVVKGVDLNPVPGSNDYIEGIMNLRGKVIPVINLEKRFNLELERKVKNQHIVVAEVNEYSFGILVDSVNEVLPVSPENIQPVSETLAKKIDQNLLKGIIVDDERLILYLNIDMIFTENVSEIAKKVAVATDTSSTNKLEEKEE